MIKESLKKHYFINFMLKTKKPFFEEDVRGFTCVPDRLLGHMVQMLGFDR